MRAHKGRRFRKGFLPVLPFPTRQLADPADASRVWGDVVSNPSLSSTAVFKADRCSACRAS
eukprot:1522239-Amphidinium_carterae.2